MRKGIIIFDFNDPLRSGQLSSSIETDSRNSQVPNLGIRFSIDVRRMSAELMYAEA